MGRPTIGTQQGNRKGGRNIIKYRDKGKKVNICHFLSAWYAEREDEGTGDHRVTN